jgi:hypothetical protein
VNSAFHGIANPRRFARTMVALMDMTMTPDEWNEMEAEALVMLCEMARAYDPSKGTFTGYATRYMPRRLAVRYRELSPRWERGATASLASRLASFSSVRCSWSVAIGPGMLAPG